MGNVNKKSKIRQKPQRIYRYDFGEESKSRVVSTEHAIYSTAN